jgi:hypothetical protein
VEAACLATTADETIAAARELFVLVATDREKVLALDTSSVAALRLFELLPRHPSSQQPPSSGLLKTTKHTAGRAVEVLADAGVLFETTGKRRGRAYSYKAYLDRLRDGTDLDVGAGRPEPTKSPRPRTKRPR